MTHKTLLATAIIATITVATCGQIVSHHLASQTPMGKPPARFTLGNLMSLASPYAVLWAWGHSGGRHSAGSVCRHCG